MDNEFNSHRMKILVVEDNHTQAEYLRHFLEKSGDHVITASNGIEAMEQLQFELPDIILTDVMMPEMNGLDLCKRIKNTPETADIPVILVTYLYNTIDIIKALESGADSVIIKPYNPDDIHSRIWNIIHEKDPDKPVSDNPLSITFLGESYTISSGRVQIVNILLSTYEIAIRKNNELQVAHERLHYLNAQLQKAVADLEGMNAEMHKDHLECIKLERALDLTAARFRLFSNTYLRIIKAQIQSADLSLLTLLDTQCGDIPLLKKGIIKAGVALQTVLRIIGSVRDDAVSKNAIPSWYNAYELFTQIFYTNSHENVQCVCTIHKTIEIFVDPLMDQVILTLMNHSLAGKNLHTITVSLEKQMDCVCIIFKDDSKWECKSVKDLLSSDPDFIIAQEILHVTGIDLTIDDKSDTSPFFSFSFPENAIRSQDMFLL